LTGRALESHRLEVRPSLLERTPVDAIAGSEDHDLVEELVDLVTSLVCRREQQAWVSTC
jgi:hypothetical protein